MGTTTIPRIDYPGENSHFVDNGRKQTSAWAVWTLNISRSVRTLLKGLNSTAATADGALPKSGGTMTGAIIFSPTAAPGSPPPANCFALYCDAADNILKSMNHNGDVKEHQEQ